MRAPRGARLRGATGLRARRSRPGVAPVTILACAAALFLIVVPAAGADLGDLVPSLPDLSPTVLPTTVETPQAPLKVVDDMDDVLKGITLPEQSPAPEGGGGGGGGGGGNEPDDDSKPEDGSKAKPDRKRSGPAPGSNEDQPASIGSAGAGDTRTDAVLAGFAPRIARGAAPGLATLATRARDLVTPLAAPMGLGLVAMVLLGLASRGPGVITKLNEELESADGRQVWRL